MEARATSSPDRTILGPLTTTFIPPAGCTNPVLDCRTCNNVWQAQSCYSRGSTLGVEDKPDCWPPRATSAITPIPPLLGWGFYSPGILCPAGHTSACSATAGGYQGWDLQFGLVPQETAVGCCPSGYTCTNYGFQTCEQFFASTTFTAQTCYTGDLGNLTIFTVPTVLSGVSISTFNLHAPLIQINWQYSDLSDVPIIDGVTVTASSTSTSSVTSDSSAMADPGPTTSPSVSLPTSTASIFSASNSSPPLSKAPASSLSLAVKVGIGFGVFAGLVCFGVITFIFVNKRRSKNGTSNERSGDNGIRGQREDFLHLVDRNDWVSKGINAEYSIPQMPAYHGVSELSSPDASELPHNEVYPKRHELEGPYTGAF